MAMLKVIILLLIISSTFVDARARRKRRQLSSASYYISNINPYSSSYNPSIPLTYPSGSYYSAPSYGYPNTGFSGDQPYDSDYSGSALGQYTPYPYGMGQTYQFQNLGSTYGSGAYSPYLSPLYGYGPMGFNNQYPNWNQGNSIQYYTGGTGSGLTNTGYYWYRSALRNIPPQWRSGDSLNNNPVGSNSPIGPNPRAGQNLPVGMNLLTGQNPPVRPNPLIGPNPSGSIRKSAPVSSSGK